jgi:hypothetical protein
MDCVVGRHAVPGTGDHKRAVGIAKSRRGAETNQSARRFAVRNSARIRKGAFHPPDACASPGSTQAPSRGPGPNSHRAVRAFGSRFRQAVRRPRLSDSRRAREEVFLPLGMKTWLGMPRRPLHAWLDPRIGLRGTDECDVCRMTLPVANWEEPLLNASTYDEL